MPPRPGAGDGLSAVVWSPLIALEFDDKLNVGHALTTATIIVSGLALWTAWRKDRRTREREIADRVRSAAARTLAKFERWEELARWAYRDIHPVLIEVTTSLEDTFDVEAARDLLVSRLTAARSTAARRILDEEIENAYVDLYGYAPEVYEPFTAAVAAMRRIEDEIFEEFVRDVQGPVLAVRERRDDYSASRLGDNLRTVALNAERKLSHRLGAAMAPVREYLLKVVSQTDEAIIERRVAVPAPTKDAIASAAIAEDS